MYSGLSKGSSVVTGYSMGYSTACGASMPSTRPQAGTDNAAHQISLRLASALIAATVMAEPPSRPLTTMEGTGGAAISAALDSAAPTKPTGQAMMAAGLGQSGSCSRFSR